jgi:hypothetical protein
MSGAEPPWWGDRVDRFDHREKLLFEAGAEGRRQFPEPADHLRFVRAHPWLFICGRAACLSRSMRARAPFL